MQQVFSKSVKRVLFVMFGLALLSAGLSGCGGGTSSSPTTTATLTNGSWGGELNTTNGTVMPATLVVTASGGQMTIACQGPAQYNGTVILDSTGHFSVTGTSTPCCTPNLVPTRFDGTVVNNVLTLTLTNTNTNTSLGTYTITLGQAAPAQNGVCPG